MSSAHRYQWTRSDGSAGQAWRVKWSDSEGRAQYKRGFKTKAEALRYAEEATRPVVTVEVPAPRPEPPTPFAQRDPRDVEEIRRLKRELSDLRRRWTVEEDLRIMAAEEAVKHARREIEQEWATYASHTAPVETRLDLYRDGFMVYLLRDEGGTVVYVGQSIRLLSRLGEHVRDPLKARARTATVLRCESAEHMREVEDFLIDKLQPPLNIFGVKDGLWLARKTRATEVPEPPSVPDLTSDGYGIAGQGHDHQQGQRTKVFYA